jgi:perosamine synthetase
MKMRIGRTLPPAAVPIPWKNIFTAALYCFSRSDVPRVKFENELKHHFGAKHCFLLCSGKAAFSLILQVLHQINPKRDEVLIPAFTCYSVPAAIKKAGLKIRLCDLQMETLDFDIKGLKEVAKTNGKRNKLLCAVPTHMFGIPADIEMCRDILGSEVKIVEDAAQAMGIQINEKKLGILGDLGFFSLGRGKALSTMEGGIIFTNNDQYAELLNEIISDLDEYNVINKIKLVTKAAITNVLQKPSMFWLPKSLPFLHLGETIYNPDFKIHKLSNAHCCLASKWSATLDILNKIRKTRIRNYIDQSVNVIKILHGRSSEQTYPLLRLPFFAKNRETREKIVSSAAKKGLGLMPSYPTPINEIIELKNEFSDDHYTTAKTICDHIVTLPVHEYVSPCDQQKIIDILSEHESV